MFLYSFIKYFLYILVFLCNVSIFVKDIKYKCSFSILTMDFVLSNKEKKELFVSLFQVLKNCSTLINCNFEDKCLHIQGMDKSHVCLYDMKIEKDWFDSYNVEETKKLCFDSNVFHSIISTKSDNQDLVVKLDNDNEDTLHIQFTNKVFVIDDDNEEQANNEEQVNDDGTNDKDKKGKKKGKKEKDNKKGKIAKAVVAKSINEKNEFKKLFKIPLSEYEYEEMAIPVVDYDAEFSLSSKLVVDMFAQLNNFGNDIMVKCSEESIHLTTTSVNGEMCVQIPIDDLSSYSIVEGEEVILNYSLLYLNKMCITNKLTSEIEFFISNECPMKIAYPLGEGSSLVFYMAPKSIHL